MHHRRGSGEHHLIYSVTKGGGGPGTSAAFVVLREQPLIAVVLSDVPELPAELRAHELLTAAIRDGR